MAAGPVCSVPVFEETEAIVLEEKVSTPGTETGPRDPQTPGPARVPPRAPGKGAPSAHDPLPSPGRAWAGPHWPVLVIIQGWPEAPSVELLYPRWSA